MRTSPNGDWCAIERRWSRGGEDKQFNMATRKRQFVPLIEEWDLGNDGGCLIEEVLPLLHEHWEDQPHTFWLDSGGTDRQLGRYSFMGTRPYAVVRGVGDQIEVLREGASSEREITDPFDVLARLTESIFAMPVADDMPPFCGGAVGYLAYDLCHFIEELPAAARRDISMPDLYFAFYDHVCCVDHLEGKVWLIANGLPHEDDDKARAAAEERMAWLRSELKAATQRQQEKREDNAESPPDVLARRPDTPPAEGFISTFTRDQYVEAVQKAKEYIAAGDISQVNLSQRFTVSCNVPAPKLFRRLREVSPAPFGAYLYPGPYAVLSASPERFLRIQGEQVETRPIKGTRPRGEDQTTDVELRNSLIESEKDRAEHMMIVDAERSDLGRFCEIGSVDVPELMMCEAYRNVFHLVSKVTGRLKPNADKVECIRAAFPGGSITGTPKVRAMEIINELEPVRRGVYTGAIGYLGIGGNIDLSVAIRTLIHGRGRAYFHVGGGIVADSNPHAEYEETLDKAEGLVRTLLAAAGG